MARYDYECPRCQRVEEHSHRMKADPDIRCPDCRVAMVRLPCAGANVQSAKDSGWEYENDGRGRLCQQLGSAKDDHAYCRSRQEFRETAARQGYRVENA
jgi:putative FmdB family regulatory protein